MHDFLMAFIRQRILLNDFFYWWQFFEA